MERSCRAWIDELRQPASRDTERPTGTIRQRKRRRQERAMPRVKAPAKTKVTQSQIKAVLSARDAKAREEIALRKTALPGAQARRRAGERLFTSYLRRSGFDFTALEKQRTQNATALRRVVKGRHADAARRSPAVTKDLQGAVASWRHAIEHFRDGTLVSDFVPVFDVVATPFIIWPTNDLELVDSQIQPGNNTAKINAQWRKSYGFENLRFIFLWQNPKDSWVIVSIASNLMLNGECDEFEEGGYLSGSVSNLNVDARLNVLEWWNQPPTSPFPQATQAQHVLTLSASGGGVLSNLGGGTVESATVAGTFDLSRSVFLIPPNGVAVFEVTLAFVYDNSDGGMVQVNFASSGFQVMCPSLVIGILS
jgi:hypothetical protein